MKEDHDVELMYILLTDGMDALNNYFQGILYNSMKHVIQLLLSSLMKCLEVFKAFFIYLK